MSDIKSNLTSYPSVIDTATLIADCSGNPCVGGDQVTAIQQNGPNSAIVAIENVLGITPQGSAGTLVARLAVMLNSDGGLLRGTNFPSSPPALPHLFYRTDVDVLYFYDLGTAAYVSLASSVGLTNYVRTDVPATISAQHTFNPVITEAPFLLGANAQGQRVIGATADTLWDGAALRSLAATGIPYAIPEADSSGTLRTWLQTITALQTSSTTLLSTDFNKIQNCSSGASFVLSLPAAAANTWSWVLFKNINTGAVTISVTADGIVNPILSQYDAILLYSDGTNWHITWWLSSTILGVVISTSSQANAVPKADGSGKLSAGWGGNASGLATLDANTRLVQDTVTAYDGSGSRSFSATPGANKIPVADANGVLGSGWAGLVGVQILQTPGDAIYTPTPGTHNIIVELLSGAGGGGGTSAVLNTVAGAGGGGGYALRKIFNISGTRNFHVADGGAGGGFSTNGADGQQGAFFDVPLQTFTVTIASPAVFTAVAHGLAINDSIQLSTDGALPTGLSTGITYYIISAGFTVDSFRVSTTRGGAAVNTSGTQSGTHKLLKPLLEASGGVGGVAGTTGPVGSSGGIGVYGDLLISGSASGAMQASLLTAQGSSGGPPIYGSPMALQIVSIGTNGLNAPKFGVGGTGAISVSAVAHTGGNGSQGLIIIREYS